MAARPVAVCGLTVGILAGVGLSGCDKSPNTGPAGPAAAFAGPSNDRSELCSGANIVGVGLRGEYFAAPHWQGQPLLVRTDVAVDFAGLADLPNESGQALPASVRWSGWIKAPTSGSYRFHLQPSQARMSISRQDVKAADSVAESEPVEMVAGRFYPIQVEVDELKEGQLPVRLEWTAPHGARYLIPRALLNLPTETVAVPTR